MSSPATVAPSGADAARATPRRQRLVVTGLFLTFGGLFLVVLLFPSDPHALATTLPVVAFGLLLLWAGGIMMGRGMGNLQRRRRG